MVDPWGDFEAVEGQAGGDDWSSFEEVAEKPKRRRRRAADGQSPTGQVHDGDTFRLRGGDNARLYGADAFELKQTGRGRAGNTVPLGADARAALVPFAQPDATVTPTGAETYGRPVASLSRDGRDAAGTLLRDGNAIATPEYLKADPDRLGEYMEAERFARQNRRGAWSTQFEQPASYRHGTPDPWAEAQFTNVATPNSAAVFWDDPTPFQGLRPDVANGYAAIFQNMASKPEDLLAYAKANGFKIDEADTRKRYAARDRDKRASGDFAYVQTPRVVTDPGDGKLGAFARGVADPINMLDEMGAVLDSIVPNDRENVWDSDRRFGDIYANNLDQNRSVLAYDDSVHPYMRFGGQLASGVLLPGASVEGVGLAAARRVLEAGGGRFAAEQAARTAVVGRLAVAGAAEGGLAGVGAGEDAKSRFQGGLIGAPAGAVLAAGAGVLAPKVAQLVGRPFNKLAGREGEAAAQDFTDGAIDTARSRASNDIQAPEPAVDRPAVMAMENETPTTTLIGPGVSGPRVRDTIDVNNRPRLLLDPATEAQRRAQAATMQPGDVMPLPANRVDGIDEAVRIDAGRIEPVRAPDEMAELGRRNLPSPVDGTRTIPKRGPVDLVTYLRTQGGLRGEGGELQHLGIDNAPRKGMDFAGGEQRFGRLVDQGGMGYDEAATRAWEAGYFPDHAEPPTISEFIDALGDTHSGRNRSFLPDDLEEVDRFAAARQQRYDVEAAAQEGDPLYQDRSEPISEADLDKMSAPVTAYEEWGENAPRLAGNLRLDKLDSPESIKRALAATHARVGGFDAATRGRITQAETKALADDLGMTADDLLKRRKGQAFNAEEALAARQILARSTTDLVNMARQIRRVENPGDEAEAAFREAWLRHAAIQEQVSGMTAEAGRLLQQFRMTADSRDAGRVLSSLGDSLGGIGRMKEVAERIVDLENVGTSAGGINAFALRSLQPRWKDKLTELYINSLLSGPQTHAVNILSNTLTSLAQIPEHAVAAGVGVVRRALPGQAATDRVMFTELGSRAAGMVSGAREGMRLAARSFLTGDTSDAVSKVEQQQMNAIGGKVGSVVRIPTRLLSAEDELFKGIARRMEMNGVAMRRARNEGLKGQAARDRAAQMVENPDDALVKASFEYARYLTFQTPVEHGSMAAGLSQFAQRKPIVKLLVPFIRTPVNLLKFAAERSPAAAVMKSWRREYAAGGARRDLAVARSLVGTGVGAAIYEMALAGHITGSGPSDQNARRLLRADGWQPYSLKIGDKYYSYARLDPFSTTIGTVADMVDMQSHMTERQQERSFTLIAAAITNNLASKTWLSGISSAMEAVSDPDRYMDGFIARTAGAIAVPSIVNQVARSNDPILREARGPMDRIISRIPGQSDRLFPRRDVFGRPVRQQDAIGPDIVSPLWTGTRANDPTIAALIEAGTPITPPQRSHKVDGKPVRWTPAEYDRLQELTGRAAKPELDALIRAGSWKRMDENAQEKAVADVMKAARSEAKAAVLRGAPASDEWAGFEAVR